jgi:hypothetical protein
MPPHHEGAVAVAVMSWTITVVQGVLVPASAKTA